MCYRPLYTAQASLHSTGLPTQHRPPYTAQTSLHSTDLPTQHRPPYTAHDLPTQHKPPYTAPAQPRPPYTAYTAQTSLHSPNLPNSLASLHNTPSVWQPQCVQVACHGHIHAYCVSCPAVTGNACINYRVTFTTAQCSLAYEFTQVDQNNGITLSTISPCFWSMDN
jgi:hypothetical protein